MQLSQWPSSSEPFGETEPHLPPSRDLAASYRWPIHPTFHNHHLQRSIEAELQTNSNIPPPELANIILIALQGLQELMRSRLSSTDMPAYPTPDEDYKIQTSPTLSLFTTFTSLLAQIDTPNKRHETLPVSASIPTLEISMPNSPSLNLQRQDSMEDQSRAWAFKTLEWPTSPRSPLQGKGSQSLPSLRLSDMVSEDESDDEDKPEESSPTSVPTPAGLKRPLKSAVSVPLFAENEQIVANAAINLLIILSKLVKDRSVRVTPGGQRFVFSGGGDPEVPLASEQVHGRKGGKATKVSTGRRRKNWEARVDGVIRKFKNVNVDEQAKGVNSVVSKFTNTDEQICGLFEAKCGPRTHEVRYQEIAEIVAFARAADVTRRDEQQAQQKR
ncbi:unnamed protein product [Sphagnum balticum]